MTYAFSRDDVEAKLLPAYLAHGILPANPFAVLDQEGVGELVRIACDGRPGRSSPASSSAPAASTPGIPTRPPSSCGSGSTR